MLEQVLAFIMPNLQLITAALLFAAIVFELIHIGQTRRINKKLSYAGRWLQRYLNVVLNDNAQETDERDHTDETERQTVVLAQAETKEMKIENSQLLKSRQEENMRVSLANKKLQKDEELIYSVLQEIFD